MISTKNIETFNRAVKGNHRFKKVTDTLYFAQIPKNELGAFKLIVNDAGIYAYEYPGYDGVYFEIVYKLSGGHFNTAVIGKVEDNKFTPFNLKDFPDEITVLPRDVEKQLNDKITNALL
jgi:hypothetical protein